MLSGHPTGVKIRFTGSSKVDLKKKKTVLGIGRKSRSITDQTLHFH